MGVTPIHSVQIRVIGRVLNNRYTITARLGKGAMGTVYRASDMQSGRDVALKVISSELIIDSEMLERFKREGEALSKLKHPNIVEFLDAFQYDENYVIVMEFVSGGSLHELISKGPLPIERANRIALELCDALIRSHHLNIIHRDLKPENVLIAEDGTPKLADFGVARLSEGTRMTRSGTQVGTPYYMSPEAWEGKTLDAQADIWSLGVILFEMLTGQLPFGGDTGAAVMNKVLTTNPPDLKKLRTEVPPNMAQIIKRMLTRNKNRRFQTMRQVAVDLESGHQATSSKPAKAARVVTTNSFSFFNFRFFLIFGILIVGLVVAINYLSPPVDFSQTETPVIAPTATTSALSASIPTFYDDFSNPAYDDSFNPAFWQIYSDDPNIIFQKDGILTISQTGEPMEGTALAARPYFSFVMDSAMAFEAKLMLDPEQHQNSPQESGGIHLSLIAESTSKETWVTLCELIGDNTDRAGIWCHDWWNNGELGTNVMEEGRVSYGSWHTFRIEIEPTTMTVTYFINGDLIGSFVPINATKLETARFISTVEVWTNSADTITGYVDDVRIYPIPK